MRTIFHHIIQLSTICTHRIGILKISYQMPRLVTVITDNWSFFFVESSSSSTYESSSSSLFVSPWIIIVVHVLLIHIPLEFDMNPWCILSLDQVRDIVIRYVSRTYKSYKIIFWHCSDTYASKKSSWVMTHCSACLIPYPST
jgi:hypothetical protein